MMNMNPLVLQIVRKLRTWRLMILDAGLIWLLVLAAIYFRLEHFPDVWEYLTERGGWTLLAIAPLARLPIYFLFDLYKQVWRYASMETLRRILLASAVAPVGIAILNFGLLAELNLPYSGSRSVWLLEALCSAVALAGSRIALRALDQNRSRPDRAEKESVQRTLIVGAGDAGAMISHGIHRTPGLGIQVVGFVDDDSRKLGSSIDGKTVLGDRHQLPDLIDEHIVQQIIIAMPTAPGKVIREVVRTCEAVHIRPRIVPSLHTLVNGFYSLNQLRPVEIDDLLRREPIVTDLSGVHQLLHGRRVLVTGGGGSIGSELCRQIIAREPAELIILGHGENSVFEIEQELNQRKKSTRLITCIADIRMIDRIHRVFQEYQPEVVFHAAAHKHVPLMEAYPGEAVTNNVLGTKVVLDAAQAFDVKHFIMISSDKAVNPTSVMGATKRVAELLVLDAARRTGRTYQTVRFGNVLGSRGSVVHTFKRQIAAGGPVTVTDRRVTRYFMTIPEAVQLTLQAAILGHGGEIFMLDMGEPVAIVDLAKDLIRLSGLEVGADIEIVYTGMRPGEKMYEELLLRDETYQSTVHDKIRNAAGAVRYMPEDLTARVSNLIDVAWNGTEDQVCNYLVDLVPEYQTNLTHREAAPKLSATHGASSPTGGNGATKHSSFDAQSETDFSVAAKVMPTPHHVEHT